MAEPNATHTESDGGVYDRPTNLLPSEPNSNAVPNNNGASLPIAVPQEKSKEPVKFDPESEYYDMSGEKIMLIFNHIKYDKKFYGGERSGNPPASRELGGPEDAASVNTLFTSLGFKVDPYEDKTYADIIKIVTKLCRKDHSATSCVAVVIMTHGSTGGILFAYDSTYLLSEIIEIFDKGHDTLVQKPKLFFIQACRGESVDSGKTTYYDGEEKKPIHVPTLPDYLFARSAIEDYRAYRYDTGSWFLQELCKVIETHHNDKDLLQMLTMVTRRVAYDHQSYNIRNPALSYKKATPETKFTLTKLLKL